MDTKLQFGPQDRWPVGIWCLRQALEPPIGFDLSEDFQSAG